MKAGVSPANRQTNDSPTNSRSAWRPNCPRKLPPQFPRDALSVMKPVLDLLGKELDPGETMKVIRELPPPLHVMWSDLTRPSTPQL